MTRMTRPDCAVMCNLINIHTYIHTCIHTYIYSLVVVIVLCWGRKWCFGVESALDNQPVFSGDRVGKRLRKPANLELRADARWWVTI